MLNLQDANSQVQRLEALLREVVPSSMPRDQAGLKHANYDLATIPRDWLMRRDAATTYVPVEVA